MSIYLKLIWAYFKISIFGFGGGYAMLSLIRHEIVDRGWITEHMFTDIVAISQMTPGPIGINSATYIGYTVGGGVKYSHYIKGIFAALRPVVVGLIGSAALLLMNHENFDDLFSSIAICAVCFVMAFFYKIHPILIIVLAGLTGYIIY